MPEAVAPALPEIEPAETPIPANIAPAMPWENLGTAAMPRGAGRDWSRTLRDAAAGLRILVTPDGRGHVENPENLLVEHEHVVANSLDGPTRITTYSRLRLPDGDQIGMTHSTTPAEAAYTPGGWERLREGVERVASQTIINSFAGYMTVDEARSRLGLAPLQETAVPTNAFGNYNIGTKLYATNLYVTTNTTTTANTVWTYVPTVDQTLPLTATFRPWQGWNTVQPFAAPAPLDLAALRRSERRRKVAQGRAKRLLRDALDEAQLAALDDRGYFEVRSPSGRTYRIYQGMSMNVVALDDAGREALRLCAHPGMDAPSEDHMLAQKLVIETDERGFLKVANRQSIWTPDGRTVPVPAALRRENLHLLAA